MIISISDWAHIWACQEMMEASRYLALNSMALPWAYQLVSGMAMGVFGEPVSVSVAMGWWFASLSVPAFGSPSMP